MDVHDNDSLTDEERAKSEKSLLEAANEFISNQAEKSIASNDEEDDLLEPDKKRKKVGANRKATAKKDKVFDAKLAVCNEVRKHPELYQITHKGYQNKQLKDAIWQDVSEAVSNAIDTHTPVEECKKHWTALKESTR